MTYLKRLCLPSDDEECDLMDINQYYCRFLKNTIKACESLDFARFYILLIFFLAFLHKNQFCAYCNT